MSSTVANTKESVRKIQQRGSVFLARSEGGGRVDFNSQAGNDNTRSSGLSGDGIEMKPRIGIRSSARGSSGDADNDTGNMNSEGGSGMGRIGEGVVSAKHTSVVGRLAPERPDSLIQKTGIAAMVPAGFSRSPSLPIFPGEEIREAVRNDRGGGENVDAPSATTSHAVPSGMTGQSTFEQDIRPVHRGLPTTDIGVTASTGSIEKSQPSPRRARRGPSTEVEEEQQGRDREQRQSLEEHQTEGEDWDNTAATKIGNILAELPLSKIKIVIGKF